MQRTHPRTAPEIRIGASAAAILRLTVLAAGIGLAMAPARADAPRQAEAERLLQAGQGERARALLEADVADAGAGVGNTWPLVRLHASQGRIDAAVRALEQLFRAGQWLPPAWLEGEEALAPLRADGRYQALLERARAQEQAQQRLYGAAAIETPYREQLPLAERLAGVSRLWSEAKYNFANFDLVPGLDWDALYLRTLERVQRTPRTLDYYRELQRMMAALRDGHSGVYPDPVLWDRLWAAPALRTARIEGRVLVTELLDPKLEALGLRRGQEIVAVDGLAVERHVRERVLPWVSASTPQDLETRAYGRELLAGDAASALRLKLRDEDGRVREIRLQRLPVEQAYGLHARPALRWRMLAGEVALVELNGFDDDEAADEFIKAFDAIAKARAIVFDLRHNGGGNSSVGYRILATLAEAPVATSRWWSRGHVSAWRAWGRPMPVESGSHGEIEPDREHAYRGRVAVLSSAATYSAAEDFVAAFRALGRGPVVGGATGGSTGQPLFFKLPGGGQARVCAKRDLLADGSEFVGRGIAPDLAVAPTLAGWRAGRDEVLEAALARLQAP